MRRMRRAPCSRRSPAACTGASRTPHRPPGTTRSDSTYSGESATRSSVASPTGSGPSSLARYRAVRSALHLPQRGQQLVAHEPHARQRVAQRHAEPVRAEEEKVRADRFPARTELLVAFLRATQHEAVAEERLERLAERVAVGQ